MKLYFRDLPCYQNLSDTEKNSSLYQPNACFNLNRLPNTSIRDEFAPFLYDRASSLSFTSLRIERGKYNQLAAFITQQYPRMKSITEVDPVEIEKKLKKWLFKSGIPITVIGTKLGREIHNQNPLFGYLRTFITYMKSPSDAPFDKESNIWMLDKIPLDLRASPISSRTKLDFSKIKQDVIRSEFKECCYYRLSRCTVSTVARDITVMNEFSAFISDRHPEALSLSDIDRNILEDYLSYTYVENCHRKSNRSTISTLKSILSCAGRLFDYKSLRGLFLPSDFEKQKTAIYRSYSDAELLRIHEGLKVLEEQTARLILLHELLGLRISDTMTLKRSDVVIDQKPYINLSQQKTDRKHQVYVNDEILRLLQACIEFTTNKYGNRDYIFVDEKNPDRPMKYSTLYSRMEIMIYKLDLRDDHGKPFTVGTHLFRHTYGKRLCDLLNDDATIAALLGHASISTVHAYRQMSPATLAENTKSVIEERNNKINKYKKGWML